MRRFLVLGLGLSLLGVISAGHEVSGWPTASAFERESSALQNEFVSSSVGDDIIHYQENPIFLTHRVQRSLHSGQHRSSLAQRITVEFGISGCMPVLHSLRTNMGTPSTPDSADYADFTYEYLAEYTALSAGAGSDSRELLIGLSELAYWLEDMGEGSFVPHATEKFLHSSLGQTQFGAIMVLAADRDDLDLQVALLDKLIQCGGLAALYPVQQNLWSTHVSNIETDFYSALWDGQINLEETNFFRFFFEESEDFLAWQFG